MASELIQEHDIRRVLETSKVVVVLGAHANPSKPAHYVPDYLVRQGYRVIPVNPAFAGRELFGERVRRDLGEVVEDVDILDVFRRSQALPDHLEGILTMPRRPKVVWFQQGIRNDDVARSLVDAGIDVVQDRCTMADHRRMGVPAR